MSALRNRVAALEKASGLTGKTHCIAIPEDASDAEVAELRHEHFKALGIKPGPNDLIILIATGVPQRKAAA